MWELDRKLLQQHALPLVERYTWETGTVLKALEMDEFVPPPPNSRERPGPRVARRIQRSGRWGLPACVSGCSTVYFGVLGVKYRVCKL